MGVEVGGGSPLFAYRLGHGEDPHQRAWEDGFRVVRPLSASGTRDELVVTLQVTRHGRSVTPRGPQRTRSMIRGLDAPAGPPLVRQRLAAYALVVSDRGILATEFSDRTAVPGLWSLPGGGLDEGENPWQTVHREVFEESGIRLSSVEYFGSQPWPFPRSVMLGFRARAATGAITVDGEEIVSARWFSREALLTEVAAGTVILPGEASIAFRLVRDWLGRV